MKMCFAASMEDAARAEVVATCPRHQGTSFFVGALSKAAGGLASAAGVASTAGAGESKLIPEPKETWRCFSPTQLPKF